MTIYSLTDHASIRRAIEQVKRANEEKIKLNMEIIEIHGEKHKLINLYVEVNALKELPTPGDYVHYVVYCHGQHCSDGYAHDDQIKRIIKETRENHKDNEFNVVWFKNLFYYKKELEHAIELLDDKEVERIRQLGKKKYTTGSLSQSAYSEGFMDAINWIKREIQ